MNTLEDHRKQDWIKVKKFQNENMKIWSHRIAQIMNEKNLNFLTFSYFSVRLLDDLDKYKNMKNRKQINSDHNPKFSWYVLIKICNTAFILLFMDFSISGHHNIFPKSDSQIKLGSILRSFLGKGRHCERYASDIEKRQR